jgi:Type IV pilin-like G and H, putative
MIVALASATVILPTQAAKPAAPKPAAKPTIDLKAQKTEGKQMTGTLTRSQQAYYLENAAFATNLNDLGRQDNLSKITSYRYQMRVAPNAGGVMIIGRPTKSGLPTYLGLVQGTKSADPNEAMTVGAVCESIRAQAVSPPSWSMIPKLKSNSFELACPRGFKAL